MTDRILAVNDNSTQLDRLVSTLRRLGFTNVCPETDGGNAWGVLKSKPIDCVISAYDMAEMSGLALLKILRREADLAGLPFFLTDEAFTKIKVLKAGHTGVTGLFVLPVDHDNIKKKLITALEKKLDPVVEKAELDIETGKQLIASGQYGKALTVFQTLINQRENPEYYYNIGYIKTSQGQHSEAIEAFSKATQLDRLFVKAYEAMAESYKAMGDDRKAEECLQIAAEIYMDTDKLGAAEDILNKVLESGTRSLNIFNTLGVLHRKKGDMQTALRNYKKALKVHPDEPYIYYNIGRLYLDMKQTDRAKHYFQSALDRNHDFEEAKQVIKAIDLGII